MGQHQRTADLVSDMVRRLGPGPWTLEQVRGVGLSYAQVRRAVDAGRLVRPHRGVLDVPGSSHHDAVRAALLTAPVGAVVSHHSAAVLHGLWTPRARDTHVHLTVPGDQDEVRHGVRVHGSPLPPEFVTRIEGLPVTSLPRTAVDVARLRRLPDALVSLDGCARLLAAGPDALTAALRDGHARTAGAALARRALGEAYQSVWSWPGSVVVREALRYVDPASESPFESWSRGCMIERGLPMPRLAVPVTGASGATWWADFVWDTARVVGEADGLGKYGATGEEVRRSLARERHRQRDIEDAGWTVLRWDSREPRERWLSRLSRVLSSNPRI